MSTGITIVFWLNCIALVLFASNLLTHSLDRLFSKLNLPEGVIGLLTALGANMPEISSAITALLAHQRDIGVGVVLGSNLFNLAALLGLSAVIAGKINVSRPTLLLHGTVSVLLTLIASALVLRLLGAAWALALLLVLFVPYAALLVLRPRQIHSLPLPPLLTQGLARAASECKRKQGPDPRSTEERKISRPRSRKKIPAPLRQESGAIYSSF